MTGFDTRGEGMRMAIDEEQSPVESGPNQRQPQNGGKMIKSISISNFRCYKRLEIDDFKLVNVIVGDNGSGKTALLEALFMPLAPITEMALRYRQTRGLDGGFTGSPRAIEDAIFADLFHQRDCSKIIEISVVGDGIDNRSVTISRSGGEQYTLVPLDDVTLMNAISSSPIQFTWKNSANQISTVVPIINNQGMQLGGTGEEFDNFFYFPAHSPTSAIENASRFSSLSRQRMEREFIDLLSFEFNTIEDLSIEVVGGGVAVHAAIKGVKEKLALPNVSGAINRLVAILLAMTFKPGGALLVDEMENGIYYKHHLESWRIILLFARKYKCQIFTTTHSQEWMKALLEAASDNVDDVTLCRVERDSDGAPVVYKFSGEELKDGIEYGVDVRAVESF